MAQSKILVDSNSYLRLAKSVHPLLDVVFGEQEYCLYVLKDLEKEYDQNARLRNKFHWVNEDEFFNNRQKKISVSRKDKQEVDRTIEFLEAHKYENRLGTSTIDIKYLAHANVLSIPVVTDDMDMLELARAFAIKSMTSLELMALMLESDHLSINKVQEIAGYWRYTKDTPANYKKEYKKLFKENAP